MCKRGSSRKGKEPLKAVALAPRRRVPTRGHRKRRRSTEPQERVNRARIDPVAAVPHSKGAPVKHVEPPRTTRATTSAPTTAPPATSRPTTSPTRIRGIPEPSGPRRNIYEYQAADGALRVYLETLAERVLLSSRQALCLNLSSDNGGYLDRWTGLARRYLARTLRPREARFLEAAYGYAVEKLTEIALEDVERALPRGWRWKTQVSKGSTRPDLVLYRGEKDAAWLDFTSEGNVGHISRKAHSGWRTRGYVYEITYPPLDRSKITTDGAPAEGVRLRGVIRRLNARMERAYVLLKEALEPLADGRRKPSETRAVFQKLYADDSLGHSAIRSLIELAGLALADFGYTRGDATGRDKAAAVELVRRVYLPDVKQFE